MTRVRSQNRRASTDRAMSGGVAELLIQQTRAAQRSFRPAGLTPAFRRLSLVEHTSPQDAALRVLRAKHGWPQVRRWLGDPEVMKYSVLARYRQQFPGEAPFARVDALLGDDPTYVAARLDRRVLRLNALERAAVIEACPEFTVEPVQPVAPAPAFGFSPFRPIVRPQASGELFDILVRDDFGAPVVGADVLASPDGKRAYTAQTDGTGVARFTVARSHTTFTVLIRPSANHWPRQVASVRRQSQVSLVVSPLVPSPQWWRTLLHVPSALTGRGVRIGVVDSGASHPALTVRGGRSFLDGGQTSLADGFGHGTHCAGIIAARPDAGWEGGLAPDSELYVYRVFDDDGAGGDTDVLGAAIDQAVADGCHLINLSLTTDLYTQALHNAVKRAADAGVLCVAASGNDHPRQQDVMFPARHPEVASVGAIGQVASTPLEYPGGQAVTSAQPAGTLYTAAFSCRGQSLKFAAPGVAVISTVPLGHAAVDGTSMAAPMVTGVAALLLERNSELLQMPPDRQRCEALLSALATLARDLLLPRIEQGSGCPVFS